MLLIIGPDETGGSSTASSVSTVAKFALTWAKELDCNFHILLVGDKYEENENLTVIPKPSNMFETYLDSNRLDLTCEKKVRDLCVRLSVKRMFASFTCWPLFRNLKVPCTYFAHHAFAPYILSSMRQTYWNYAQTFENICKDLVLYRVECDAIKYSDSIICDSQFTYEMIKKYYNVSGKFITAATYGIDLSLWANPEPLRVDRSAIFFGRLSHQKGIPLLFIKHPPRFSLTTVGCNFLGGYDRKHFLENNIELLEYMPPAELRQELLKHTFCLFPAHFEPRGLALTEALATGRICLAQKGAGGHEEQITNGRNGFLVDFNVEPWYDIIEKILEKYSKDELINISERAKKTAYDSGAFMNQIAHIFNKDILHRF